MKLNHQVLPSGIQWYRVSGGALFHCVNTQLRYQYCAKCLTLLAAKQLWTCMNNGPTGQHFWMIWGECIYKIITAPQNHRLLYNSREEIPLTA